MLPQSLIVPRSLAGMSPTFFERVLQFSPATLIAYWLLHGGSLLDASGNGRGLTSTGTISKTENSPDGLLAPLVSNASGSGRFNAPAAAIAAVNCASGAVVVWARVAREISGAAWNYNIIFRIRPVVLSLQLDSAATSYDWTANNKGVYTKLPPNKDRLGWHCWAASWDNSGSAYTRLFCDGVKLGETTGYTASTCTSFMLCHDNNQYFWNGSIKHFAIWSADPGETALINLTRWEGAYGYT